MAFHHHGQLEDHNDIAASSHFEPLLSDATYRRKVDAMCNALTVGQDQRWPRIGLGLVKRLDGLQGMRPNRNLGNINVSIGHRDHAYVFLSDRFPCRANFATAARGVDFDA